MSSISYYQVVPAVVCLVFSILTFFRHKPTRADITLGMVLLVDAFVLFMFYFCYLMPIYPLNGFWDTFYGLALLILFPLLDFYTNFIFTDGICRWKILTGVLPVILLTLITGTIHALFDMETVSNIRSLAFITIDLYNLVFLAYALWFTVDTIRMIKKYYRSLDDYYSTPHDRDRLGEYLFIAEILVMCLLTFVITVVPKLFRVGDGFIAVALALQCATTFAVGMQILPKRMSAHEFKQVLSEAEKREESVATREVPVSTVRMEQDLQVLMTEQRLFLKHNLTITDIAIALNTNRTYISQLINQQYGQSFSSFINQYRVAYAKEQLAQNSHYSLETIASNCGFASYSSFFRAFKSLTGTTPNEHLNH